MSFGVADHVMKDINYDVKNNYWLIKKSVIGEKKRQGRVEDSPFLAKCQTSLFHSILSVLDEIHIFIWLESEAQAWFNNP